MKIDFLKDSGKFFLFRVVVSLGWIGSLIILTRLLAPDEYGTFVLLNSIILLSSILSTTWISASILRFAIEYKYKHLENIFRKKMIIIAVKNIIIFSILALIALFLGKFKILSPLTILVSVLWYILQSLFVVLLSFLRAFREVNRYGFYNAWQILGGLLLGILSLLIFRTHNNALFFLILGYVFALLIGLPFLYREVIKHTTSNEHENSTTITKSDVSVFFNYGLGVTIINLCSQSISQLDKLFITSYHGVYKSGIYSASYSIAEQSIFAIVSIFSMASAPIIYSLWQKGNKQDLADYFSNILRYYFLIITPLALFIVLMYNEIGGLLLDDAFISAFNIIPIVTIGAVLVGYATIYTDILTATKKPHTLMLCYIFAIAANIIGNFLWIPKTPFFGASFSTLISYFILLLAVTFYSRKEFRWKIELKLILKICLISIGIYLFFMPILPLVHGMPLLPQLMLVGLSETIIFLSLIFIFKLISIREIKQIFSKEKFQSR